MQFRVFQELTLNRNKTKLLKAVSSARHKKMSKDYRWKPYQCYTHLKSIVSLYPIRSEVLTSDQSSGKQLRKLMHASHPFMCWKIIFKIKLETTFSSFEK